MEGRVALITGAAQHLGFEIAGQLAKEGMRVALADIQKDKGGQAALRIREQDATASFHFVDLKSHESVCNLVREVDQTYGGIDLLLNNARPDSKPPPEDRALESWSTNLDVVLSGAYHCIRETLQIMERQGRGSIVNISSVAESYVTGESIGYHAAKGGLAQLTRYVAAHWGPKGIRINNIAPGFIIKKAHLSRYESDTRWKNRWEWCHPVKRAGNAEDLSNAILFLASDLAGFITGQTLAVDGGITVWEPGDLVNRFSQTL